MIMEIKIKTFLLLNYNVPHRQSVSLRFLNSQLTILMIYDNILLVKFVFHSGFVSRDTL